MKHPDVEKLEKVLEKQWDKREVEEIRQAIKKERDVDETVAPMLFYCTECEHDYVPRKVTKIESDDWNLNEPFRFWRSVHDNCQTPNIRLITDKVKDKFFIHSETIKRDRRLHKLDMLQPQETGFNMLYGNKL